MARTVAATLALCLAGSNLALAAPPEGPAPAPLAAEDEGKGDSDEAQPDPVGTLSRQGSRRGALEFGIGALLVGTGAGLVAFGVVQFIQAGERAEFCGAPVINEQQSGGGIDPCVFDPPALGYASAGLSWGFAAGMLIGSGFVFARAVEIQADARAHDRLQVRLSPWWAPGSGGARLGLRF